MTNETAPERIFIHHADQIKIDGTSVFAYTSSAPINFRSSQTEYVREDISEIRTERVRAELEAAQARIAELEQHIADMIDDSGQECACGYDNPTDICLGHLPMYRKTQARIAELEGALRLAEADITYAFERFGFPKERSSSLTAIRAALEGKG